MNLSLTVLWLIFSNLRLCYKLSSVPFSITCLLFALSSLHSFFSCFHLVCCFSLFPLSVSPFLLSLLWNWKMDWCCWRAALCVMNESCPREREGTLVYTAEYRLMFSCGEEGNVGRMEGWMSLRMNGRKEGRKDRWWQREGRILLDRIKEVNSASVSPDDDSLSKCQKTWTPSEAPLWPPCGPPVAPLRPLWVRPVHRERWHF